MITDIKSWKTREVKVGKVGVGGNNPIRIQSMTTSPTQDIDATIEQIIRIADAGCEIARVTVQGMKEAKACEDIKNGLIKRGYDIPLVADIHFYPPAAFLVADFVDKVRINPGNFVDRRATFKILEYDDKTYAREIQKIEEKFTPLVEKCRKLGHSMRLGVNHGSLSDRIMNRYGDTPLGMVQSAIEFARVCRKLDYHDFIFSMKASNPQVMIEAYRLLVSEMVKLGWDYPLHLGVTEAGEGEDGRIKSAVGIGALLLDGIGDTIRVSLTEDPWQEMDPCSRLIEFAKTYKRFEKAPLVKKLRKLPRPGKVFLPVTEEELMTGEFSDVDGLILDAISVDAAQKAKELQEAGMPIYTHISGATPILTLNDPLPEQGSYALWVEDNWENLLDAQPEVIFFAPKENRLHVGRRFFTWLEENDCKIPVILAFDYPEKDCVIQAAAEAGALLADRLGEGVALKSKQFSLNLLQACRMRSSKTEFISCPGCGRTLFDLQEVARRIRSKTGHLPGVKIAIMGCIVNGPGEMADADFGYVGSKPGKIDLYVGKTCVERDIPAAEGDERLIALIKSHGRWVEI